MEEIKKRPFIFFIDIEEKTFEICRCSKFEEGMTVGDLLDVVSDHSNVPREEMKAYCQFQVKDKEPVDEEVLLADLLKERCMINIGLE